MTQHNAARQSPIGGQSAVASSGVKSNKVYTKGRTCVQCGTPLSIYNKHKTCWSHTPIEKYMFRGGKRAAT